MKRFLILLIFALLGLSAFPQETIPFFKKFSIGVNHTMDFRVFKDLSKWQHFGGLSFDHQVYKGFYASIEIDYNREVYTDYVEDVLISGVKRDSYESYVARNNFVIPISLKYYFLKNSETWHPFVKLGMRNEVEHSNGYVKIEEDKSKFSTNRFEFNFQFSSGLELKLVENLFASFELLYYTPMHYKYNLRESGYGTNDLGFKFGVSYLF